MQRNDCKFKYLRGSGFTGSIQDMEYQSLQASGAPDGHINDMWMWVWNNGGIAMSQYNDMAYIFLTNMGYSGALADMWTEFWCDLADDVPSEYTIAWDETFYDSVTGLSALAVLTYALGYDGMTFNLTISGEGAVDIPTTGTIIGGGTMTFPAIDITVFDPGTVQATVTITNPAGPYTGPPKTDSVSYTVRTPVSHLDFSDYIDNTLLEDIAGWEKVDGLSSAMVIGGVLRHTILNEEASYQYTGTPTIDVSDMAMAWKAEGGAIPLPNAIIDDADNLIGARVTGGSLGVFRRISGAWTLIGAQLSGRSGFETYLTMFAGTDISVFQDGVLVRGPYATGYTPGVGAMPGLQVHGAVGPIASELFVWDMSEAGPPGYP